MLSLELQVEVTQLSKLGAMSEAYKELFVS
jgi:hypothetical protein